MAKQKTKEPKANSKKQLEEDLRKAVLGEKWYMFLSIISGVTSLALISTTVGTALAEKSFTLTHIKFLILAFILFVILTISTGRQKRREYQKIIVDHELKLREKRRKRQKSSR